MLKLTETDDKTKLKNQDCGKKRWTPVTKSVFFSWKNEDQNDWPKLTKNRCEISCDLHTQRFWPRNTFPTRSFFTTVWMLMF